jgi:hypothetical protein
MQQTIDSRDGTEFCGEVNSPDITVNCSINYLLLCFENRYKRHKMFETGLNSVQDFCRGVSAVGLSYKFS